MDEYFVEEKTNWDRLLDFLVFIAVFAVTIFLILEILAGSGKTSLDVTEINSLYYSVNIAVFIIFILDLYRLWNRSASFNEFVKVNWLDILATIPFGLIAQVGPSFEILKWTRLSKLSNFARASKAARISKIGKEFKAASHLKKESDEYKRKHRL